MAAIYFPLLSPRGLLLFQFYFIILFSFFYFFFYEGHIKTVLEKLYYAFVIYFCFISNDFNVGYIFNCFTLVPNSDFMKPL